MDVKNINSAHNPQYQQNNSHPTIIDRPLQQGQPTIIEKPSQDEYPTIIEHPKKSKKGLWIFLSIILVVGIGAAIWISIHHHNEKLKAEQLALIEQQRLDSIAAVEAELAKLEQLRLDSIRQNSIKDEEANRIHPKMFKYGNFSKLESLGFKKVYEKYEEGDQLDFQYCKYERVFNGRKTIYDYYEGGSTNSSLTFEDKDDKYLFLKELKGLGYKKSGNSYETTNFDYPPIYVEGDKIYIAIDY